MAQGTQKSFFVAVSYFFHSASSEHDHPFTFFLGNEYKIYVQIFEELWIQTVPLSLA